MPQISTPVFLLTGPCSTSALVCDDLQVLDQSGDQAVVVTSTEMYLDRPSLYYTQNHNATVDTNTKVETVGLVIAIPNAPQLLRCSRAFDQLRSCGDRDQKSYYTSEGDVGLSFEEDSGTVELVYTMGMIPDRREDYGDLALLFEGLSLEGASGIVGKPCTLELIPDKS